jgi:hypothetical protein
MSIMKPTQTWPEILGYICGLVVVGLAILAFKAWLLTVILGWFGVTVIGFWKATAIIIGLDLLFYSGSKK